MRLRVAFVAIAALFLTTGAEARASAIEGTWNYGSGLVLVRATSPTSFVGTVVKEATFSSGCPHPVGERMWVVNGSGPRYSGTHFGFSTTDSRGCAERQRVTYPSTFEVSQSGTAFSLRFCTQYDGKEDCSTLTRAAAPAPPPPPKPTGKNFARLRMQAEAFSGAKTLFPTYIQTFAGGDVTFRDGGQAPFGHFVVQHEFLQFPDWKIVLDVVKTTRMTVTKKSRAIEFAVKVRTSTFSACKFGAAGLVTLLDAAPGSPDRAVIRACGDLLLYLHGKPDRLDRVTVTIR